MQTVQGVPKKLLKVDEKEEKCVEIIVLEPPQRSNLSTHDKGIWKTYTLGLYLINENIPGSEP